MIVERGKTGAAHSRERVLRELPDRMRGKDGRKKTVDMTTTSRFFSQFAVA
jgi:hypothetical protein